jgi:hypothetical protein
MKAASGNDISLANENRVSLAAALLVAAGLAAAWIAAGSSGLLAHSLRHVLTCLVLGAAVVVGWSTQVRGWRSGVIFVGGMALALGMAVFPLTVVNILAVVVVLSTLAHFRGGLDGRAIFLAALAVLGFAVCHFLYGSCPPFWFAGDRLGRALGWLAGKLTGQQLSVGATFGGVDFLVLMAFLYGLWLYNTAPPRGRRALYGGLAIAAAQLAYLATLAFSEKIAAALPTPIYTVEDDYLRMGAAVWQNSLRSMIPWSLPTIALLLQSLAAAVMFRRANWRIALSIMPEKTPTAANSAGKNAAVRTSGDFNIFTLFAPAAAAVLLAAVSLLWTMKPDLNGKTIVAYQSAEVPWTTPQHGEKGENGYGLLPDYVQSLGGKFELTHDLTAEELSKADAVLLLKPDAKFSSEHKKRLEEFVARGGSLLIAADRRATEVSQEKLADLLEPSSIQFERDFAASRTARWEQTALTLNHPVSLGIDAARNGLGWESGSALRLQGWAYPLVVGQWGNESGGKTSVGAASTSLTADKLGDLVLVAEADRANGGKIIVLGDMTCLSNDMLPISYEFVGRLFGYLAQKTPAFPLWRTALSLFLAVLVIFSILLMRKPSQSAVTAVAFALALVFCRACTLDLQRIVPGESEKTPRALAYIDASHLEAYSDQLWHPLPTTAEFTGKIWFDQGLGNFARTLAKNGYLPLRMKEFAPERLERGSLFISIAPGRSYSAGEIESLRKFVENGGTLLCMAGAEESRAVNPLLEQFHFRIPHSPAPPRETAAEPEPQGAFALAYTKPEDNKDDTVHFFAAWEIDSLAIGSENEHVLPHIFRSRNQAEKWIIASRNYGDRRGCVAVIADTYFAANENPDVSNEKSAAALETIAENERFWEWFLPRIANPEGRGNADSPKQPPASAPSDGEPFREDGPDEG